MKGRQPFVAAVLLSAALVASHADEPPLPYRLSIGVAYGDPLGPESLRDELERELVARLRDAECFDRVEAQGAKSAAGADVIVELVLDGFDQQTRYDVSIATQHREDGQPESKQQHTAAVGAVLHLQVRRGRDRALVKMERARAAASRRAAPGVDPRREVYEDLIDRIVRKTRSYLCKPSYEKWQKQIREARPSRPTD